jgi:pSer/pThr/pTyr-binding forkhead associated (FHA) protein
MVRTFRVRFDQLHAVALITRTRVVVPSEPCALWHNPSARGKDAPGTRSAGAAMPAVEVWTDRGRERVVTLTETSYTIGSDASSATIAVDDGTVSRVHAVLERVGTTWLVRDLGSRNGTRLNGERLTGQRRLHDGEEVLVGRTKLVFRDAADARRPATDVLEEPPANLTPMERRVLVKLCTPLLSHNTFQPPASVREIAARLFIGKNAVQAHLTNLYDKFAIPNEPGNRRVLLANAAIQRGVVTIAELEKSDDETDPDV